MGFTIGSGGGPPPDNSVSEDKIVNEAVSEAKLSAAVVAQLGGGGSALSGVCTQHGAYSDGTCGSTNTDIVIFGTDVGSPSADVTNSKSATLGSIFTVNTAGWYAIDVVLTANTGQTDVYFMIASNATVTNDPLGKIIGQDFAPSAGSTANPFALRYFSVGDKFWVAKGAGKAIYNLSPNNLDFNRIFISRIAGPGSNDWESTTQGSNGNTLTLALANGGGELYEIEALVLCQTATSLIEMELNQSTGSYTYYQQFNGLPDSGVGSYVLAGSAPLNSVSNVSGKAFTSGTLAAASVSSGTTGVGVAQAYIYKTLGAPANLTHITIKSNTANGIGAGSFIKARKVS